MRMKVALAKAFRSSHAEHEGCVDKGVSRFAVRALARTSTLMAYAGHKNSQNNAQIWRRLAGVIACIL